jgi:hypothetical protein
MNIKASLMVALAACIMLVGVAAAQENPEAGDSWNTQATFALGFGNNYINGELSSADSADYWRGPSDVSGVSVKLYLNQPAYGNGGVAELCEGSSSHPVMQHVQSGSNWGNDFYLNTAPAYVRVTPAGLGDYTCCVKRY